MLANGSDHLPIEPELPEILAGLERRSAPRSGSAATTTTRRAPDGLPVHEGELVGSRLQNILRGVNSARIYLKQANERAERRLLVDRDGGRAARRCAEDAPYPAADLRLAWRDLLRNHPHDSICGCSCDEVHRDMLVRYEQLDRTLDYRRTRGARRRRRAREHAAVSAGAASSTGPSSSSTASAAAGAEPFAVRRSQPSTSRRSRSCSSSRTSPTSATCTRSAPAGRSDGRARLVASRRDGDALVLEHELPGITIETTIRAVPGLGRVELTSVVENEADDHRLRVLIRSDTGADEVRAESQFAVVRRPLVPPPPRADWVEPPVPTAHTLGAVALGSLVLLTKGLPEYEAAADGLRLTLLRCVGTISRPPGLPTRPLAAGPDIATPDGQCRGRHVFEYALRFDGDKLSNAALVRASQDYRTDFLRGDPFEPPLELGGDVVFSCLKRAEDGTGSSCASSTRARSPRR